MPTTPENACGRHVPDSFRKVQKVDELIVVDLFVPPCKGLSCPSFCVRHNLEVPRAAHVSIGDRIWSNLPFLRPLVTITGDSLASYGVDAEGGRVHDLLGTRCDPYVNRLLTGVDFDYCCHSNLTRAILPFGLTEFDVHDVLNVFQCTGLNSKDQYFMKSCPAKKGDFFEFFAEVNLLCAMSTCPGGDLSIPCWGPEARDPIETCRPLYIEIFKVSETVLRGWNPPQRAEYRGNHGLRERSWPEAQKQGVSFVH